MASNYRFSKHSWDTLKHVHPKLVAVATLGLRESLVDFRVERGIRDEATQREYVAKGWSKTMHSKHLPDKDGLSRAIDLLPYVGGKFTWEPEHQKVIAVAMKKAAEQLGVRVRWGGDWRTWQDYPHWELVGEG